MPRKNPETKFKEKVRDDLKPLTGIWFTKIQQVAIRGIPDFLLCKSGKFVAFELKVDSDLTELQKYNLDCINKSGGIGCVVTPDNWPTVYKLLQEEKWEHLSHLASKTLTTDSSSSL